MPRMLPHRIGVSVAGIIIQILRPINRTAPDYIIHRVSCTGTSSLGAPVQQEQPPW